MIQELTQYLGRIREQALQLGAAPEVFAGVESVDAFVDLFLSPRAIAFCARHHYPNTSTFRLFKGRGLEARGIYIDGGSVTLVNPARAVLIGRTIATVRCDSSDAPHEVIVLHGAKALVTASKWAVVKTIVEEGSTCIKTTNDNAIVI